MKQDVVIKGSMSNSINGITVILNPEISFEELLPRVAKKFKESAKFFKNTQMAVTFEGRELNDSQQQQLLDTIIDSSSIEVLYLIENNKQKEQLYENRLLLERLLQEKKAKEQETEKQIQIVEQVEESKLSEKFYKGTLRSGQAVESDGSLIVMGDINPGASVSARGNIIVLGSLKGVASAGTSGDVNAFVVALEMIPMQIRISDTVASCSQEVFKNSSSEPMIAFMKENDIYIEPITKEVIARLDLKNI